MIRQNLTKTFSVPADIEHPYMKDILIEMGDSIMNYFSELVEEKLGYIRYDDHPDSHKGMTMNTNYSNYNYVHGNYINRVYKINNSDTNLFVIELIIGQIKSGAGGNINLASSNKTYAGYGIITQFYYSRTNPTDWITTNGFYTNNETASVEVLKNSRIKRYCPCIYNNGVWTVDIPLQFIGNSTSSCFTFNISDLAIPRIGNMQVTDNGNKKMWKCFVNVSNDYPNNVDEDNFIDPPKASNILVTDDEYYRYGVPLIIRDKSFINIGDKMPTMPIFISQTDTTSPTSFNFSKTIDGFLQTSKNNADSLGSRFNINGSPYINIGNGFLMKE